MILLNNIFFDNLEYDVIQNEEFYNIKVYNYEDNIWYGCNKNLLLNIKHNTNIYTLIDQIDINNIKINKNDEYHINKINIMILFDNNEIFIKNNKKILQDNFCILITNQYIEKIFELYKKNNINIPNVIYNYSTEYTFDMLNISKKIINHIKPIYNIDILKICIINTNIFIKLNQDFFEKNINNNDIIVKSNLEEDIENKDNDIFYIKLKNIHNGANYNNTLKEIIGIDFYI